MKHFLLIGPFIGALASAFALAALWHLDLPLASKVAVVFLLVLLSIIAAYLHSAVELMTKIHAWQRATFVAVENQRIDQDNKTPAWDLLSRDIKAEKEREAIASFFAVPGLIPFVWTLLLAFLALCTFIFITNWSSIEPLFG